jgi:hypothetical protein
LIKQHWQVNGIDVVHDITVMKETAEQVHQEVLELITALSEDSSSDTGSFVCNYLVSILHYLPCYHRLEVCFPILGTGVWLCPMSPTYSHNFKLKLPFAAAT